MGDKLFKMSGMELGDPMDDADMVTLDGMGMGGEMTEAGRMSGDEMLVKLDGRGMGGEMTMAAFDGRTGVDAELDDRDADDFNLYGASGSGDLPMDFGVDPDETSSVGGGMLRGTFVGDEDDDGNMEIY